MEVETYYADSGGVSIAYQAHGEGPIDLVLVPGFVSHVELPGEDHPPFAGDLDAVLEEIKEFLVGSRGATEAERAPATILFTEK
jgi:hypothetical protein